jgi:hypothetical protein
MAMGPNSVDGDSHGQKSESMKRQQSMHGGRRSNGERAKMRALHRHEPKAARMAPAAGVNQCGPQQMA